MTLGLGLDIEELGSQLGIGLDRIFKSRQDKSWSHLKFSFKRSLGIGLKREKIKINQDQTG